MPLDDTSYREFGGGKNEYEKWSQKLDQIEIRAERKWDEINKDVEEGKISNEEGITKQIILSQGSCIAAARIYFKAKSNNAAVMMLNAVENQKLIVQNRLADYDPLIEKSNRISEIVKANIGNMINGKRLTTKVQK